MSKEHINQLYDLTLAVIVLLFGSVVVIFHSLLGCSVLLLAALFFASAWGVQRHWLLIGLTIVGVFFAAHFVLEVIA